MQHNNDNITMQLIANRLEAIQGEVGTLRSSIHSDIKEVTSDMGVAINKLVEIEANNRVMNQAYDRLQKQLEKADSKFDLLESRVDSLEKDQPDNKRVTTWVYSLIWGALALVASGIAKYFGFI